MQFLMNMDRKKMTVASLAVAVVFLFFLNILVSTEVTDSRLDLTQNKLFTLSDGTREVLDQIDEPIKVRFYFSRKLAEISPQHGIYATRVRELLENYAKAAGGDIDLEIINPEPFSVEEDDAVRFGLQGIPLDQTGERGYFGLVATNSTDDREMVPFFDPSRERFLEYDLTRMAFDLAAPKKKTVGLLTSLLIEADPMLQYKPWPLLNQINQFFQVKSVASDVAKIDDDIDVLLLIHPKISEEKTLYAIDQFIMRGGKAVVFVDPHNETARMSPRLPPGAGTSDLEKLFKAWGIEYDPDNFVGDRATAVRVSAQVQGRDVISDYVSWQLLDQRHIAADDIVTGQLTAMSVASPGALGVADGSSLQMTPLIQSTPISAKVSVDKLQGEPDPAAILRDFKPDNNVYTYAARYRGKVNSAFPDGPPKPEEKEGEEAKKEEEKEEGPGPHVAESEGDINLVVLADSDLLSTRFWLREQEFFGQRLSVPVSNNADFLVNAAENLSGSEALIGLRSRGLSNRPFFKIVELQNQAEDRYRQTERQLTTKLKDLEEKLSGLKVDESQDNKIILTAEQQRSFDNFRAEMLDVRKQLRDVQHALRSDIEALDTRLKIINIWVMPIIIAVVAVVLAVIRRRRYKQASAA